MLEDYIHSWFLDETGIPIICLHGFTGCGSDFSIVADHLKRKRPLIAPNFPDYRSAPSNTEITWATTLSTLDSIIEETTQGRPCVLVGYSMGGRIALQYALQNQSRLKGLVLIGATPGIEEADQKAQRLKQDNELAEKLTDQTIDDFITYWLNQPVLKSQEAIAEPYRTRMLEERGKLSLGSLSKYLQALGTGTMPSAWHRLNRLAVPTVLVTGEQDFKFTGIAHRIVSQIPGCVHTIIKDSGHSVCFEQPTAFTEHLETFVENLVA